MRPTVLDREPEDPEHERVAAEVRGQRFVIRGPRRAAPQTGFVIAPFSAP